MAEKKKIVAAEEKNLTFEEKKKASSLDVFSMELFENIGWLMEWHNDPENVQDSPEKRLDEFSTFSIFEILPRLIELWGLNMKREMTTPLFLLRCVQIGISLRDLDLVTIGCVNDLFAEKCNDSAEFAEIASQKQMDAF